jgi:tRNA threonylcarbamoyladenosine biosynthesis protein TsaE
MKILSKSLEETQKVAEDFLKKISDTHTHTNTAMVVGLFGDLGSGKTTFTQALGKILGVKEVMTSPTFVIQKNYPISQSTIYNLQSTVLIHIDAYRLESGRELEVLGFKKLLSDSKNLILIEWPERVADILPADLIKINFKFISEFEREIDACTA